MLEIDGRHPILIISDWAVFKVQETVLYIMFPVELTFLQDFKDRKNSLFFVTCFHDWHYKKIHACQLENYKFNMHCCLFVVRYMYCYNIWSAFISGVWLQTCVWGWVRDVVLFLLRRPENCVVPPKELNLTFGMF